MKRFLIIILAVSLIANLIYAQEGQGQADPAQAGTQADPAAQPAAAPAKKPKVKVKVFGKVRYRFQYQGDETENIITSAEESERRERQRIRVYLGAKAKIGDQVRVGVQLATGGRQSHNDTLGDSTPYMGMKDISLLKAYISLNFLDKMLKMHFGKFKNPMYNAKLVMTGEINPEGMAQQLKLGSKNFMFGLNLGEFVYQTTKGNRDADGFRNRFSNWIIAPQLFVKAKFGNASLVFAPGLYLYTHRDVDSAVAFLYQDEVQFSILDLYLEFKIKLGGNPLKLKVEFTYNLSKPKNVYGPTSADYLEKQRMAMLVELSYGKTKKQWDWAAKIGFAHIQRYALDPYLTNSDFMEYDGTDTSSNEKMNKLTYGIYAGFKIVLLPNTTLDLYFLYYKGQNIGYDEGVEQYDKTGWLMKLSLDVKF